MYNVLYRRRPLNFQYPHRVKPLEIVTSLWLKYIADQRNSLRIGTMVSPVIVSKHHQLLPRLLGNGPSWSRRPSGKYSVRLGNPLGISQGIPEKIWPKFNHYSGILSYRTGRPEGS
jgi:hypothetical protein